MTGEPLRSTRLDSWKNIAAYLERDVRTVIRWEQMRGLPVHRLPGGTRSAVFAFTDEIDAWMSRQAAAEAEAVPVLTPEAAAVAPVRRRLWMAAALGAVAVLLVGGGAYRYFAGPAEQPAMVSFTTDTLQAWDHHHQLLWEYRFPEPFGAASVAGDISPIDGTPTPLIETNRARVIDLFGDGKQEVLAITHFRRGESASDYQRQVLSCFSSKGKLLWSYEPQNELRFGARTYSAPWDLKDMIFSDEPGRKTIWVNVLAYEWGKSFIARLDAEGHATVQFVHSGEISTIQRFHGPLGALLWIGGFNDEYDTASVAIVRDTQAYAVSPQTAGTRFACVGCATGDPLAYFVLPRYDMSRALHVPNNKVYSITSGAKGIEVNQAEISPPDQVLYDFSNDADPRPVRVNYAASFWPNHLELERQGKITHPLARCPDRLHPPPVRIYQGGTWREIVLPGPPAGS